MAFVTAERWAARGARGVVCDVVGGQATFRANAWQVPLGKRLLVAVQAHRAIDRGRRFDVRGPGNAVLDWYDSPDLAAFETFPGELAHLAEFGAHISALRLEGPPTRLEFEHELEFPPGTRFEYQPALTPEEVAMGCVRPRAVVGSYAVFDATGAKIAHIPCPVLVDATGAKYWGSLTIVGRRSRVTFPASLTGQVTFPVVVYGLDTFGYTTIGGSVQTGSANYVVVYGPWQAASAGNATSVSRYGTVNGNANHTFGFYSGSDPYTLMGDTGGAAGSTTAQWFTQNLDASVAILAAINYKPATNAAATFGINYDAHASLNGAYKASTYSHGTLPANPSGFTVGWTLKQFSIYVTYTPTAAGQPFLKRFGGVPFAAVNRGVW